jgi:uncharacterized Zn finger protein (UPF0148 family)
MAQKIEVAHCPSCGAPVKFLDGREDTFCTSCGHQLFREDTNLALKLKHEEFKMEFEARENEKQKENEFKDVVKGSIFMIIAGAVIYVLFAFGMHYSLELLCH